MSFLRCNVDGKPLKDVSIERLLSIIKGGVLQFPANKIIDLLVCFKQL